VAVNISGRDPKLAFGNAVETFTASLATGMRTMPDPIEAIEFLRLDALRRLPRDARARKGQFFTPKPVAQLMASLFTAPKTVLRILDPGAGVGSLFGALISVLSQRVSLPREIDVTAVEMDPKLCDYIQATLGICRRICEEKGIRFQGELVKKDFLAYANGCMGGTLDGEKPARFNCVILNPPYKKLNVHSQEWALLEARGLRTTNLYTAFLGLAISLLEPEGELVAITPRSFCSGPYFRTFRKFLLKRMALRDFYTFSARDRVFEEDDVLQENIILSAIKRKADETDLVRVHTSTDAESGDETILDMPYTQVVNPGDKDAIINLIADELQKGIAAKMRALPSTLRDIGIEVSTGRVVDFRSKRYLRSGAEAGTVPLIYPMNLRDGAVVWPGKNTRKPVAIVNGPSTSDLLVPTGTYVLVKRFTTKEEKRRLVATVFKEDDVPYDRVGFENHLNYYHSGRGGLPPDMARGIAAFLNSTYTDEYFRQFNGHTQVNAADLRNLRYPPANTLMALGAGLNGTKKEPKEIDTVVEREVFGMSPEAEGSPSRSKLKIEEALQVLKALGLPREQQNERSALTLLALLDLKPNTPWSKATNPMRGITEMMEYFQAHYGKHYAPNTRETVRRFTVHQFLQAGICVQNPDQSDRPVNSPNYVYQIQPEVLVLFRAFSSKRWLALLRKHLKTVGPLQKRYERERIMQKIPVKLSHGNDISLSPGSHNELMKKILDEFCPRFAPGAETIYVGDTEDKWAFFDKEALNSLGVDVQEHGKMPDAVIFNREKNWLVLIEAVTSHGPVNPKRREELSQLFSKSEAGLVYVTAFLTRRTMVKYLNEISWETDVWVAESPSHLIHFDGERFLGPYEC